MEEIKVPHAGFEFRHRPGGVLRSGGGDELELDAEALFERFFESLAENGCRRPPDHYSALAFGCFDYLAPFLRRLGGIGREWNRETGSEKQCTQK